MKIIAFKKKKVERAYKSSTFKGPHPLSGGGGRPNSILSQLIYFVDRIVSRSDATNE